MTKEQYVDYATYVFIAVGILSGAAVATKGALVILILNTVLVVLGIALLIGAKKAKKAGK